MNYSKDIQLSIEFIEENIRKKLTPQIIAGNVGYSHYHFCRVFQICMNLSVMEYIRQRRLSLAAVDLFSGKKIIDIALDYGFETHSGFSKAFRRAYGYSPSQYTVRMAGINELVSGESKEFEFGGYIADPIIIKKPGFKVAGYSIKTNIEDGSYTKDIAAFWNDYDTEGWEGKMYDLLNPPKHGEVGICVPDSRDKGSLIYLFGVIVNNFDKVTNDMMALEVPEAEYAVFTTPPINTTEVAKDSHVNFSRVIKQTWRYIFEEWFKNCEYEYDERKLDFEFYDERCHFRPDTVMDIYVPIKKR